MFVPSPGPEGGTALACVAVTRLTEPGAELGASPSPRHNNATDLITKTLESQAVVTDYFQRGNCGSNKSKEGRWLENQAGLTLCFPYSKLNPRGEYMLVGLFCLVTKGQRVAVSYKKTETKKSVGCCDQREASSQLRTSKDGVLAPGATPDRSTRPALGPAEGSTWKPRDDPFYVQTQF